MAAIAGSSARGAAAPPADDLLLARPYEVRAAPSFPGALFHWIDSLAGTSAGKTVPAHREEFVATFGNPTEADRREIAAFVAARADYFRHAKAAARSGGTPPRVSAMLGVFCASPSVEEAEATVAPDMTPEARKGLAGALAWFRPKYEAIWNDGNVPRAFLERARADPRRAELESLLERVVRFYAVDPRAVPPPRIALVPVPPEHGTHAETIGGILLLEIRPGDRLADEASVIVHENAHWLWSLVSEERRARLAATAAGFDEAGQRAWSLFGEAIPTALGQGVTGRSFRPDAWSLDAPWYHTFDVDVCAKSIYATIRYALESGGILDESFLRRAAGEAAGRSTHRNRLSLRSP